MNLRQGTAPGRALEMLQQYRVDGVIVASSSLHRELVQACAALRCASLRPTRAWRRCGQQCGASPVICFAHGLRRIAFLGGPLAATSTEDRRKGFRQRLAAHGIAPAAEVYGDSFSYKEGNRLMA